MSSQTLLTRRQSEVFHLLALGLTNAQIAAKLVIAISTVEGHLKNIYRRLGVDNRTQAVSYGYRHELFTTRRNPQ